jgi:hypothetical protein
VVGGAGEEADAGEGGWDDIVTVYTIFVADEWCCVVLFVVVFRGWCGGRLTRLTRL